MLSLFEHQSHMYTCARKICDRVFGKKIVAAHPRIPSVICDNQFLQLRAFKELSHWSTSRIYLAVARVHYELLNANLLLS
jgi:hypothetical protein